MHVLPYPGAWGAALLPVPAQDGEHSSAHDRDPSTGLAISDPNQHPLAIDVANLRGAQQRVDVDGTLETVPKRLRRVFSAAGKLRIVQEADRCLASGERGALGAMLRREGIYSSLLTSWHTHLGAHGAAGLATKKSGRKPKFTKAERLNVELTERNAVLEKKLRIANALIALQKKRTRYWGGHCPRATARS